MATASTSWMPAGRHDVRVGSSLSKALKARKGQPPTQRSKALPERDFYALRYNHKPASIDSTKPGTLEVNPGREVTTVRVERPTVNNNEVVVFKGDENPAKEWECVLIYDEATQTFTLEKLDSLVNLNFDTKTRSRTRPTAPSPPSGSSSSAAQTPQRSPVRTAADELEAQLEDDSVGRGDVDADADADADGEPDPSYMLAQEDEEEERTVAAPPPPPPPTRRSSSAHHQKASLQAPQAAQQTKSRPTSTKKSALTPQSGKAARVSATNATPASAPAPAPTSSSSKPRPRPIPPAPQHPTSTPITQGSAKRTTAAAAMGNRDVEDFEIRGPIAPMNATPSTTTRRSSAATVPPVAQSRGSPFSLALPSASAGPDPLALAYQGLYNGGGTATSSAGAVESDDEWDEILTGPDRAPPSHHHNHHHHQQQQQQQDETLTITIDDEADDGLDFLERELLGEDEPMGDGDGDGDGDGYEDDDMEEELVVRGHNGPMSMNQFAGGVAPVEDDEDDDYSSSEESDED